MKVKFDAAGKVRTLTGGVGFDIGLEIGLLVADAIVAGGADGAQATIKQPAANAHGTSLIT